MDEPKEYIDELEISNEFLQIIELIGIENAIEICKIAGGDSLYIPVAKTLERPLRNKKIREEYNGYNSKKLSIKYQISESAVRWICKEIVEIKRKKPINGQISLF